MVGSTGKRGERGAVFEPHRPAGDRQGSNVTSFPKRWNSDDRLRSIYYATGITIIALGCYLRSVCYFNPESSFWADEANVVIWFLNHGLFDTVFREIPHRPIGYMAVSFLLMKIHNADWMIKLSSFIPSILSLIVFWPLFQRIYQSRLIILAALFVASTNYYLISFGNEFKPYELEFFLHLLTLYACLRYLQDGSGVSLGFALMSSFTSIFFTANIGFALPSLLLVTGLISLRERKFNHFFAILLSFLLFSGCLGAIAGFLWSRVNAGTPEMIQFYGNKYQTFYLGHDLVEQCGWYLRKTAELMYKYFESKTFPFPIHCAPLLTVAYSLLFFSGLVLWGMKKKYEYLVLCLSPLLMAILFNALGLMPYGPDRINLYLFAYLPIPVFWALDSVCATDRKSLKTILLCSVGVFFLVFHFPYHPGIFRYKMYWSTQTFSKEAIEFISKHNRKEPAQAVCLSAPAIRAFNYYIHYAQGYSDRFGPELVRDFRIYEMWVQDDDGIRKFLKDVLSDNRIVYVYLANPLATELEEPIVGSLKEYSSGWQSYTLGNPFFGEKIFCARSPALRDQERRTGSVIGTTR